MRKFLPVLLVLCCFQVAFTQTVFPDYADGQVYIKLTGASLKSALRENPANIPLSKLKELSACFSNYSVARLSRPFYQADDDANLSAVMKILFTKKTLVNDLIRDLEKTGAVAYAEKVPLTKTDAMPNDPSFPQHLTQINAPNAWNIFNVNSNIPVAIVDDAVMWDHADLIGNIYNNAGEIAGNNIDDDNNGYIDDVHGWDVSDLDNDPSPTNLQMMHGTHCAGIAGAVTDNATGVASIGWNIKIIPVKCQTDGGSTTGIANGYEGIIYAVRAHARIISCSWGGTNSITGQSVIDYAWARGSLIVVSAGNSGSSTPAYPAAYNNVYAVASVDNNDIRSGFSNFGNWVDISAPGENVNSTIPYSGTPAYQQLSGTSMAAPMVAGLAGLMLSKCPLLTATDLINCISSTAVNIYTLAGNSSYVTGNQLGAGRIEAFQAMTCAAGFLSVPPLANFFAFPASSCSNTPVQFSDSSLYAPTIWQWTFQGGTPATSTVSNPVVQWSAPGTYSVSLTVSNANGSNTKTRLSYMQILAPNAFPFFQEGFETNHFLPLGWIPKNIGNDVIYWEHKTGLGSFNTSTACAMFDNYTYNVAGDRDEMMSPKVSFSGVTQARLRFDVGYARYDATNSDTLEVKLSTDCGTSWSTIYLKGGTSLATAPDVSNQFIPTHSQWRTDSVDLSSIAGQGSVMFSFINHGQYGQPIYLDNINLSYETPTLNITAPDTICIGSSFTFTNQSLLAGSYSWSLSGGIPATSDVSTPIVTYTTPGIYTIDVSGTNGTVSANYTTILVVAASPTLYLTADNLSCGTCSDGTIQAQATGGTGALSYSWIPSGGNSATATGLAAGCYTVTVTGAGCTSTASACVDFDTGIQSLSNAQTDLIIYPNPTDGNVTVVLNTPFSYRLYNSTGQLILQSAEEKGNTINLGTYAKGIYLLEVKSDTRLLLKKIIKN